MYCVELFDLNAYIHREFNERLEYSQRGIQNANGILKGNVSSITFQIMRILM